MSEPDYKSENKGGPVNSDVSYFRDVCPLEYYVDNGLVCLVCESGEVYSPMQMAVPPTNYRCLSCGNYGSTVEYRQIER